MGIFTNSSFPAEIAVGDPFIIDFAYEDSAIDSDARTGHGTFSNAVTSFSFRLGPKSVGTYAGGSGFIFEPINTINGVGPYPSGIPERFYLWVRGGSFPTLGGYAFGGMLFVLDDYSNAGAVNDAGGGQTLAGQLGGPLILNRFERTTVRISPVDKRGSAEGFVSLLMTIPDLRLKVSPSHNGLVLITWPTNYGPCVLESATSFPATTWNTVTNPVSISAQLNSVLVSADATFRVFRLTKP